MLSAAYLVKLLAAIGIGAAIGAGLGSTRSCETGGCPLTANPLRGSLYGGFMGLLFGFAFLGVGGSVDPAVEAAIPQVRTASEMQAQVIDAPGTAAAVFSASWCGPCKAYKPEIAQVIEQYGEKARIVNIDVDEARRLANRYEVQQVPTTLVFKDGEVVDRFAGMLKAKHLAKRLGVGDSDAG
jgi:thioredoxin 1